MFTHEFISIPASPICAISVLHVSIATWLLPALTTTEPPSEYRVVCWRPDCCLLGSGFRPQQPLVSPCPKSNSCECMEAPGPMWCPKHAVCLAKRAG